MLREDERLEGVRLIRLLHTGLVHTPLCSVSTCNLMLCRECSLWCQPCPLPCHTTSWNHLPLQEHIEELTGSVSAEKRAELWSLPHKRFFFMTPQTFKNDLFRGW